MENIVTISLDKYEELKNEHRERVDELQRLEDIFSTRSAVTKIIYPFGGVDYHINNDQIQLNQMIIDKFVQQTSIREFRKLKKR
jgi:hypothetical protein